MLMQMSYNAAEFPLSIADATYDNSQLIAFEMLTN